MYTDTQTRSSSFSRYGPLARAQTGDPHPLNVCELVQKIVGREKGRGFISGTCLR